MNGVILLLTAAFLFSPTWSNIVEFTSPSGNPYTWNVPYGVIFLDVTCCGAGGAGGSGSNLGGVFGGGGGGGAGACKLFKFPVNQSTVVTLTIGAGGTNAGTQGANGGGGDQTYFALDSLTSVSAGGGGGAGGTDITGTLSRDIHIHTCFRLRQTSRRRWWRW